MVKVKVKFNQEQSMKARRWSSGITTVSSTSALDGEGGQRHPPADLPLGKTPCTLQEAGWTPVVSLDGCRKTLLYRDSISEPSNL